MTDNNDDADQALASKVAAGVDFEKLEATAAAILVAPPERDPDVPSCDSCGKEWSGNSSCTRCMCAFYCSRACQIAAWKQGGHKAECETMREESQKKGVSAVEALREGGDVHPDILSRLDMMGPYMAAVKAGLYPAMVEAFKSETDEAVLLDRCRTDASRPYFSLTKTMCCQIFRGERLEGKGGGKSSSTFGCVDAYRIKKYIKSDPVVAFDAWYDASLAHIQIPIHNRVFRTIHHNYTRHMARDIWAAWMLVMANDRAARAILWNGAPVADQEAITARAKAIATKSKNIIAKFLNAHPDSDPGGTLQGSLFQFLGMVETRVKQYGIKELDFAKLLKLDKRSKVMFIISTRIGAATIKKGRYLSMEETRVAMR